MPIDYSQYPPNWKTEIRPAVLARAGNKCEWCGVLNHSIIRRHKDGAWNYATEEELSQVRSLHESYGNMAKAVKAMGLTRVVLTIAHLDHDKDNHNVDLSRLRAGCQKCHLGHDIARHVSNRKYGRNHKENNHQIKF